MTRPSPNLERFCLPCSITKILLLVTRTNLVLRGWKIVCYIVQQRPYFRPSRVSDRGAMFIHRWFSPNR